MMRLLRGLYGTLRLRIVGIRNAIPAASSMLGCPHPQKAITACTWQIGPRGTYGWYARCRRCLAWLPC